MNHIPAAIANHILHHNNICLMEIHLRFIFPKGKKAKGQWNFNRNAPHTAQTKK